MPNDGRRISKFLSKAEAQKIIYAFDCSFHLGSPINSFLTINLRLAGIEGRPQSFTTRYMKLVVDWLRPFGETAAYVWVLENPPSGDLNVHVAFHLPPKLHNKLLSNRFRWLRLAGGRWKPRSLIFRPIPSIPDAAEVLKYMLKGLSAESLSALGIPRAVESRTRRRREVMEMFGIALRHQGEIVGKRSGTSESIGRKAQRKLHETVVLGVDATGRPYRKAKRPFFDLQNDDHLDLEQLMAEKRDRDAYREFRRARAAFTKRW